MTDEQIAAAPHSTAVVRMVDLHTTQGIMSDAKLTRDIIAALQSDGQYIVFQAPVGYRFGSPRVMTAEDKFPCFHVHTQTVTPTPAGGNCAGITAVTLEPLTGGAE